MEKLPLTFTDGRALRINCDKFKPIQEELEVFVRDTGILSSLEAIKDVMFSYELKNNNLVEGYTDDFSIIDKIIKDKKYATADIEQVRRISNLYQGYKYILQGRAISPGTLQELYQILSKELLPKSDVVRMGSHYRTAKGFILHKGVLSGDLEETMEPELIESFMGQYFNFLNNLDYSQSITDEFIKSQILHFYFVYIHPYFDVNGRTSRTLAMWYLLLKKAYPFIIFNRGIALCSNYDEAIIEAKRYHDISYFIKYMLETVQAELEKEYILQIVDELSSHPFSTLDYQTLQYVLTMNGIITAIDFATMYNRFNDKRKTEDIYVSMLSPLIHDNVLQVVRTTNKNMFRGLPNEVLQINPALMTYDRGRIRQLKKFK